MNPQLWSWILTAIGLAGFFLAGRKVWWCWYVNIANQIVWLAYSLVTHQYGFLVGTAAYSIVFTKNAISWTKEHRAKRIDTSKPIGQFTGVSVGPIGIEAQGRLDLSTAEGRMVWQELTKEAPMVMPDRPIEDESIILLEHRCQETTEYKGVEYQCMRLAHNTKVFPHGVFIAADTMVQITWDEFGQEIIEDVCG